jgi:dUTP pyrophosphatase
MITVEIKKLRPNAVIPKYATPGSAGVDLHACIDEPIHVRPGQTVLIPTGLAINLMDSTILGLLAPRSGLGARDGIVLGNLVGLCDSDYLGEYGVAVWNRNDSYLGGEPFTINPGDKICQCAFVRVAQLDFEEVDEFSRVTQRGVGGWGSTGVSGLNTSASVTDNAERTTAGSAENVLAEPVVDQSAEQAVVAESAEGTAGAEVTDVAGASGETTGVGADTAPAADGAAGE